MKIKFDCNLDAWVTGIEIEADSYDNALAKLYSMTFDQLVEEGFTKEFRIEDVGSQVIEETLKVKVYDIEYNIEEDGYDSPEEYTKILNSLPDELTVTITTMSEDDLEELLADEITYQTRQLVNNFNYMIIDRK
jgi:hypothetical protein